MSREYEKRDWARLNVGDTILYVDGYGVQIKEIKIEEIRRNKKKTIINSSKIAFHEKDKRLRIYGYSRSGARYEKEYTDKYYIYKSDARKALNRVILDKINEKYDTLEKTKKRIQNLRDKLYVK